VTWPAFASVRALMPVALATLSRAAGARLPLRALPTGVFFLPRPPLSSGPLPAFIRSSAAASRSGAFSVAVGPRNRTFGVVIAPVIDGAISTPQT